MKRLLFFLFYTLSGLFATATVHLPSILSAGMVLQRESEVKIWGWADPGENITLTLSWSTLSKSVQTGTDGKWMVTIPTGPAGGPHSITIRGSNKIVLKDIWFGEVWICSGQSNMEFTIKMLGGWKKYPDDKQDIQQNDYRKIRLCQVTHATADSPQENVPARWVKASAGNVEDFSATAWFYGLELFRKLGVPIGLISANIGGTPAEAWTDKRYLESDEDLRYFLSEPNKIHDYCAASGLYNAMIHPLINFRIKGAIWYQGESNRQQADLYTKLFPTMIGNWRDAWGQGDFPFYFVQIAPFDYGENEDASGYLREAQTRTLSVPNTGMAVTMDIGNLHNIHPADKQDVGLRLALLALNRTYGMKNAACEGPEFGSAIIDGNQIRVIFNKAKDGLIVKGEYPTCFRLAGRDMVFHPAMARIDGNSVIVSSEIVSAPLFIRYAFADLDSVNLFNKAGLPAVPFRTDSVSIFIRAVSIDIKTDSSSGERRFSLSCPDSRCQVRYTLDGSEPDIKSGLFSNPVALSQSATISARAFRGEMASSLIRKAIYCKHAAIDKPVILANPPSNLYPGGRNALVDGIRGSANYFHAAWQGYSGVDFEATIDLGDTIGIENIRAGFLLNSGSWIFLPVQVTFSISTDGVNYTKLSDFQTTDNQQTKNVYVKDYKWELAGAATDDKALNRKPFPVARYVRVFAKNTGKCPKWHPGKGDKAWLFVDELVVNEQ